MRYKSAMPLEVKLNKKLYCFGAGKAFDFFMDEFADYSLAKNIKAVVDNNSDAFETREKLVKGQYIPIITLRQMLDKISSKDIILITTAAYKEVINQLEKIEKLKDTEYCIYSVLRAEFYDKQRLDIYVPDKLARYEQIKIPKIIHYCWFGRKTIPAQYRKWMESWKKYCPDYEIIEWNENNYDVHKSLYMTQAYDLKKWAFVSDYVRVDIINEFGGVYLDTDVELLKNIDELLMNDAFCGFESSKYVNYGLGFGARKGNLIVNEIKKYYDNTSFILENGTVNQLTCPVIQTEVMKKHGLDCNGKFQIVNGMAVFPSKVLCGVSPHSFRMERNPVHTYAVHHFAASWHTSDVWENKKSDMKEWIGEDDNYIYPSL